MTYNDVMSQLQALGTEKVRAINARSGAGENQFGVKMGDLRAMAKQIKTNPGLAAELWESGILEAMLLATLLMNPKQFSVDDLDRLAGSASYALVADWLGTNVIKPHPQKEVLRERWMDSEHENTARLGWSLTTERVIKDPNGLNLPGLLDRIEHEMGNAPVAVQWTMNFCLGEIGINFPDQRERAISIGEKLGAFRDYPTPKGCTSPFVPIWVAEMVRRNGS